MTSDLLTDLSARLFKKNVLGEWQSGKTHPQNSKIRARKWESNVPAYSLLCISPHRFQSHSMIFLFEKVSQFTCQWFSLHIATTLNCSTKNSQTRTWPVYYLYTCIHITFLITRVRQLYNKSDKCEDKWHRRTDGQTHRYIMRMT